MSPEKTKLDLLVFIQKYDPTISDVVDFQMKDYDDDNGDRYEHFIVTVIKSMIDPETLQWTTKEIKCLVNREEYQKFIRIKRAVIFNFEK